MSKTKQEKRFYEVDFNGLTGSANFKIYDVYEVIYDEGFAETQIELMDELDYTARELEKDGGFHEVLAEIKAEYNAVKCFVEVFA